MKSRRLAVPAIILLAALSLPGCFSLSRETPPRQHYVLGSAIPLRETGPLPMEAGLVGLRSPALADYLSTPFLVVRRGDHRITFDETHRWGEELSRAFGRTLAAHLTGQMPVHRLVAAPWPAGTHPEHLVQVQVMRFEGVAPDDAQNERGEAHLLATWEILGSGGAVVLARGTTEVLEDGWVVGDFDLLVRMLDAGIGRLAQEIQVELERARGSTAPAGLNQD